LKSNTNEQENIRRYLLGRVPIQDLPALEERFFLDSELYEELSIVEDELIDEYLRGELAPSDRERFESHFLAAPERHEKVRFARALKKYVVESAEQTEDSVTDIPKGVQKGAQPPPKRRPFSFLPFQTPVFSYALAAAILVAIVGVSWIAWKNWRNSPPDPGKVLAVTLAPGLSRGEGETKSIVIPADAGTVRVELLLTDHQYQGFEATLLDSDGRTLTTKNLKPARANPRAVVFDVPANLLTRGDYRIRLSGTSANGNVESLPGYSLRAIRP